ncbi:hypothetical protein NQ317_003244 [Molorchus minor]|uniref:PLOD1-3-like GT domain-containing protein n=1 Tax=Molorchus minor TaxID=1323400 RepID=A0ABQ9J7K0_9CUCU|nr:hypothetical protein NQ317_003244 [Molorchus minor]
MIDVLVFTVATEAKDGFMRYMDSAKEVKIKPIVLGFGQQWKGGDDIRRKPGGGWKINLLKEALVPYKDDKDKIVLFTDGYDVIFVDGLKEIIQRFQKTNARVLFGAESYCWPDPELAPKYPEIKEGKRFLNSGMYIGHITEIIDLLERDTIEDTADDQLFFTKAYLDEDYRNKIQMKLDHKSEIFQNINGATMDLEIFKSEVKEGATETYYVKNLVTHTEPLILHGNGPSKTTLNYIGNYVPNVWNSKEGCRMCENRQIDLKDKPASKLPIVFIAIFIELNTPFLEEQLEKIHALEYPKERIHLFIHNSAKYHAIHVKNFTEKYGSEYISVKQITPEDGTAEWTARDLSLDQCLAKNCDLYFSVDSIAHIDNPHTLRLLIQQNRTVVGPMLTRPGKAWSNFWGALTKDGFYARSNDYMDIAHNEKSMFWIK